MSELYEFDAVILKICECYLKPIWTGLEVAEDVSEKLQYEKVKWNKKRDGLLPVSFHFVCK